MKLSKKARKSLKSKKINKNDNVVSKQKNKARDINILKAIRGEILMASNVNTKNKKNYNRKTKHKNQDD